MFLGGADVSGDKRRGWKEQRNHIAFLAGTEERINKIYKDTGIEGIHMSEAQREQVQRNLDLESNDVCAWCFHVERQHIEDYFINHDMLRAKKMPKVNIRKNFDHHLLRSIREELENFVFPKRQEFKDIVVQTDSDMGDTVDHWKMERKTRGKAFELADAIAWFNQRRIPIESCRVMGLRDSIKESVKQDLLRK